MISQSSLSIPISQSAKTRLIRTWGPELVLRCECGDKPSHSMMGQYGNVRCPSCKSICETINHEWGIVIDG
jgi:hypothetical protein